MSLIRIFKAAWLLCCVLVLTFYGVKHRVPDADIAAVYAIVALGFPLSWLATAGVGFIVFLLDPLLSGAVQMIMIWSACTAVGYWQWFVALPALTRMLGRLRSDSST